MPRRALRILLVEDDPLQARLTRVALEASGFSTVTTVETAAEALACAPDHDLVLLDVQLPDGNGLDVLRKLRERSSRPAVVIVTGHGAEEIAVEALRLGADDYVAKSAGFTEILPTVVEQVRRSLALRDALESAETEAVEAERRTAVGEMTVALHHEINNPLMAALTEAALLLDDPGLAAPAREGVARIRTALERIRDAVKRAGAADGARNTEYLAGALKMTDLSRGGATRGIQGRALVVAEDRAMQRVLSVLLRRAGFEPEPFESAEDAAFRVAQAPQPSVVVLAGAVGGIAAFPALPARSWALVVVSAAGEIGVPAGTADLAVTIPFDPATFGTQVVDAVERRWVGG
ncbi:MAG TPA: response regulator [Gemmatimonadales bacterium]|nr:response regulator [Gemmatimonadales bacterium]